MEATTVLGFGAIGVAVLAVLAVELLSRGPGEHVRCPEAPDAAGALEALYDMANFLDQHVTWRRGLVGAAIGALVATALFASYGYEAMNPAVRLLVLVLAPTLGVYLVEKFTVHHGPARWHKDCALQMRLVLERAMARGGSP